MHTAFHTSELSDVATLPGPICRRSFRRTDITEILPEAPPTAADTPGAPLGFGAKIDALILDMKARKAADPHARFVVFSVWKRFLAFISEACTSTGIMSLTFAGSEEEQVCREDRARSVTLSNIVCTPSVCGPFAVPF